MHGIRKCVSRKFIFSNNVYVSCAINCRAMLFDFCMNINGIYDTELNVFNTWCQFVWKKTVFLNSLIKTDLLSLQLNTWYVKKVHHKTITGQYMYIVRVTTHTQLKLTVRCKHGKVRLHQDLPGSFVKICNKNI